MFTVNNKDPRHITPCSSVSIVNFEHEITGWGCQTTSSFC